MTTQQVQATATAAIQRQAVKVSTTAVFAAIPREQRQAVKVSTTAVFAAIPWEQKRDEVEVLVRVEAPPVAGKGAPIDLVAVLDVSGSMGCLPDKNDVYPDKNKGEKSRMDLLKAAMKFVVQVLHDDDRLAIVEFNHGIRNATPLSEISGRGRGSYLGLVDELKKPEGGTVFKPALEKAVGILDGRTTNDGRKRPGFIVFLSDGQDDPKENDHKVIWDDVLSSKPSPMLDTLKKYPVQTFGFSKFHDPKALLAIAKASYGTYSFINQGLDKITDAFAVCLGGLSSVVAVDVAIELKPNAEQRVSIKSIDSGGYESGVREEGKSGYIRIPILYADETKNFIVYLSVPVAGEATGGTQVLLTADGQCHDASSGIDKSNEVVVLRQITRFKVLGVLGTFHDKFKGLKNVSMVSKEDKKAQLEKQQDAGKWLQEQWDELKEYTINGGQLDLRGHEEDMQEMVGNLKKGLGIAYICSWESSNLMECATTMGSPDKVADAYLTPTMKRMAQQAQKPPEEMMAQQAQKQPPPPPPPQATASAEKKVELVLPEAGDMETIPYNKEKENLALLVRVVAPQKRERAPIDLVALLDVSGSMCWETSNPGWTRLNLVKGAMQVVTRKLGAGDRLAIVPFHGNVAGATALTEMNEKGRNDAFLKVRHLRAGGDTKFIPALKYASDLLEKRPVGEKKSRPGFVFLLSDGEDKTVLKPQSQIDDCYPVHTFGMCQRCNPQSMLHIARKTGGTYHPVNDKPSNVAHALGVFLGGITSVVAVNTSISLSVPDSSPGVLIKQIDSGGYLNQIQGGETSGTINVGVMYANEEKKFIVHLRVPAMEPAPEMPTQHVVLTVGGGYNKPAGRKVETIDKKKVQVTRSGESSTKPNTDYYQQLMAEIVRVEVVNIVSTVVNKHKDADTLDHQQMAKQLMDAWEEFIKVSEKGRQVAKELMAAWDKFKDSDKWKQVGVTKDLMTNKDITSMHARLTEEEHVGVLYVHSWLASHLTQQATTMAASSSAGAVVSWFHQEYMRHTVTDAVFDASSFVTPPGGGGQEYSDPCKCVDFDSIDRRLGLWSRVKREVPLMFQPSEDAESHHLTAVFREASLDAINRAMHHDMYLAVVHASNLRRCYCAGKQPPPPEHGNEAPPPPLDVAKPREY